MGDESNTVVGTTEANAASKEGVGAADLRFSTTATFRREEVFEREKCDDEKREIELSFSSEHPVDRGQYLEILSHDANHADFSRLNNSHPLLLAHDPEQQIGVIESARVDPDKKGRAVVRFSKSPKATEIWNDVKDGIRRLVSVGYRRVKELSTEERDGREFVRFEWQPYEVSLVSVPADASVGVGRKLETEANKETHTMEIKEAPPAADTRLQEIEAIGKALTGKVNGISELSARAIASDWTVKQFRDEIVKMLPEVQPTAKPASLELKERDIAGYSLLKAIREAGSGGVTGLERELSDEYTRKFGKGKGQFWLPYEAFGTRVTQEVKTATIGGNLKGTELMASEFINTLKNRMVITRGGARVLSGLTGDVAIPRMTTGSTAYWAASELAAVTVSNMTFNQLSLAPKEAIALVSMSNKLMIQSSPSIEAIVRDDIAQQLAIAIDKAALHGLGSAGEPSGIYASSTNLITAYSNGVNFNTWGVTAYAALVSLEAAVGTDNVDVSRCRWLTNPKVKAALRNAPLATNQAVFCWSDLGGGQYGDGSLLGYQAMVTNQVLSDRTVGSHTTASSIFFGDISEIMLAFWGGGLDILVDPYTNANVRQTNLYATQLCDVGLRHTDAIAVLKGIEAG